MWGTERMMRSLTFIDLKNETSDDDNTDKVNDRVVEARCRTWETVRVGQREEEGGKLR